MIAAIVRIYGARMHQVGMPARKAIFCTCSPKPLCHGKYSGMVHNFKPMKKEQIIRFFQTLQAANPEPRTELEFSTPFELLVAVMLSAQATDVSVNKATATLFPVANTPQALLDLGQEGLESHIKTIGLYRSKAKHVMQTCRLLLEQHGGEVPRTREALEALPGVGRKTANVVLNVAFGEPTMAVDTHIFRLGNRTGLAPGKTPLAVEQKLLKRIPAEFMCHAHHWLILHGATFARRARQNAGTAPWPTAATTSPKQHTQQALAAHAHPPANNAFTHIQHGCGECSPSVPATL